jgi:hypothetical protein
VAGAVAGAALPAYDGVARVQGSDDAGSGGDRAGHGAASPAGHRTVAAHEWHLVGADGLPVRHRTLHVVRALRDGMDRYTLRFDSGEAEVRAVRGVRVVHQRPEPGGLTAVDMLLPRPLDPGETATFEYETTFRWRSVPPPEVRRSMTRRVERLDMRVEFSPERLPATVHWAVWDGFAPGARVRAAERVELDREHAAHRFLDAVEEGFTVGFTWTWPPGAEPRLP